MMNAQYFIDKFERIPAGEFCTGNLTDKYGRHCANGHCGVIDGQFGFEYTDESRALQKVMNRLPITDFDKEEIYDFVRCYSTKMARVNNGKVAEYQQLMAKDRVLAALRDAQVIEMQDNAVQAAKIILTATTRTIISEIF